MKIQNFIEEFQAKKIMNNKINEHAVEDYIKQTLEVKEYIPFAEKRELCAKVLAACNSVDDNGLIKVDSVSRYIVFTITLLAKYTNLEFYSDEGETDSMDDYDMLCKSGLLDEVLSTIGNEYTICNNLLNMMMDDLMANNNTIESVLGHSLNKVADGINNLLEALADKVDSLDLDLSQIDIDKYKGLIDMFAQK